MSVSARERELVLCTCGAAARWTENSGSGMHDAGCRWLEVTEEERLLEEALQARERKARVKGGTVRVVVRDPRRLKAAELHLAKLQVRALRDLQLWAEGVLSSGKLAESAGRVRAAAAAMERLRAAMILPAEPKT